jgi:hypothetical protein
LDQCVKRLIQVANDTHAVEVIVVNEGGETWQPPWHHDGCVFLYAISVKRPGRYFNKPILQNAGIEHSKGEVLTFLDADALVGENFFDAASLSLSRRLTKVCYRVRVLPESALGDLEDAAGKEAETIARWFDNWDSYAKAVEAYESPTCFKNKGGDPVFGNSQFSIARNKLGDLRFDARFESAGYEDLWMNREIAYRNGETYQALMVTDPDHAMFHIRNTREPDWCDPVANLNNTLIYERERRLKGG